VWTRSGRRQLAITPFRIAVSLEFELRVQTMEVEPVVQNDCPVVRTELSFFNGDCVEPLITQNLVELVMQTGLVVHQTVQATECGRTRK